MQKNMDKIASNSTPPSLSVSKQRRISVFEGQNTVRVSFTLLEGDWWLGLGEKGWGGGGGGGVCDLSRKCLKPCFPACGKNCRDIFSQKRGVGMPNFSRF